MGRVLVEQVVEGRRPALEVDGVHDDAGPMARLAVDGAALVGVLAVRQIGQLLQHERQARREADAADLVEIGRHLGVVGSDRGERVGGQLLAQLRRDLAALAQVGQQGVVVLRTADRRGPREVAGGRAQEGRPADLDALHGLVERHQLRADLGRERGDVDDHQVDQPDAVLGQLGQLLRPVAAGQDAGVDRRVEGLDLAAGQRRDVRQDGDRGDLHPLGGERLARAVRGVDLDAQAQQLRGQGGQALPIGDREQGTHSAPPSAGFPGHAPAGGTRGVGGSEYSNGPLLSSPSGAAEWTRRVADWKGIETA